VYIRKSMLMDYWDCPRRYKLRWIDNIEVDTSHLANFGTMFHECAEEYAKSGTIPRTEFDFLNLWLSKLKIFDDNYSRNAEIYAVEKKYICDDLKITGTIDRIDRFNNDYYRILEYKTGTTLNVDKLRRELHFYYLLFTCCEPDKEVTVLGVFNPRLEAYIEFTPTKQQLAAVKRKLKQLRKDTEFKAKLNDYRCPYCSYFEICMEEML